MKVLFQVKFPLKKKFKGYHKKDVVFIDVDIILVYTTNELQIKRKK
jgi:predicted RNA methylase